MILEDDCVPDPSFFRFCSEMLDRYATDERVRTVSGFRLGAPMDSNGPSYTVGRIHLIWGWATWRRAWMNMDPEMSDWPELRKTNWLMSTCNGDRKRHAYWERLFDLTYQGKIDTWDHQLTFSNWRTGSFALVPARNLTNNIGFGVDATHTKGVGGVLPHLLAKWPSGAIKFPLNHPRELLEDHAYDMMVEKYVYDVKKPYPSCVLLVRRLMSRFRFVWRLRNWLKIRFSERNLQKNN